MIASQDIRSDFPLLAGQLDLAYLDNAATTHKPQAVLDAMDRFYREDNANPGRGIYRLAERATAAYAAARRTVVGHLGAAPEQLAFTRSGTEALNLFVQGWAAHQVKDGDAVVLTEMEHHANLVPWYLLAEELDLEFRFVRITDDGRLDLEDLRTKVEGARVLGLTMASNVLGTINPVSEAAGIAHAAGAKVVVDAVQAAPHLPLNVAELGADAVAVTGHKMLGPTGIGALWMSEEVLDRIHPTLGGGEMIKEVKLGSYVPADGVAKLEAGTMPVAEAVGWAAALRYLDTLGMEMVRSHEVTLNEYALDALSKLKGVNVYGPLDPQARVGLVSFSVAGVHPHDLATILDESDVAIRSGHHCAAPLHRRLGVPATARASWSVYTTTDDIDRLAGGIMDAQRTFSR